MEFKDRLKKAIEDKGVTPYAIGRDTTISKVSVRNYLKGTKPSLDNISILSKYLDVDFGWLLTGNSGFADQAVSDKPNTETKEIKGEIGTPHHETQLKAIPHIEEHAASCGVPNGFSVAIRKEDCEHFIIPDMPNCDFTIRTRGRSMINRECPERNINERDIVGCRIWTSRTHLRWGEVYALATPDGIVIKQIQESDKPGHIKCVSFNEPEGFKPYDLPVDEISDWAIVVGVVSVRNWA